MFFGKNKAEMVGLESALNGRKEEVLTAEYHYISGRPLNRIVPVLSLIHI